MKKAALLLFCLCVLPSSAYALRCGTSLVSIGDHFLEVRRKCGEPAYIEKRVEYIYGHHYYEGYPIPELYATGKVLVQEWTYNFGRQRFMRSLRFENGRLKRLKTLGYGY